MNIVYFAQVSVESYLDFVMACKPDAFESLCETSPVSVTSFKRIKKSVDRTLKFLDQTLEMFEPDVCMCVRTCVCLHVYVHVFACVCAGVVVFVYVYTRAHTSLCVCVYV